MTLALSLNPSESQTDKPKEYTMIPMHELSSKQLGSLSLILKTSWSAIRTPVHYAPFTEGDLYQALLSPIETTLEERGKPPDPIWDGSRDSQNNSFLRRKISKSKSPTYIALMRMESFYNNYINTFV